MKFFPKIFEIIELSSDQFRAQRLLFFFKVEEILIRDGKITFIRSFPKETLQRGLNNKDSVILEEVIGIGPRSMAHVRLRISLAEMDIILLKDGMRSNNVQSIWSDIGKCTGLIPINCLNN